MNSKKIKEWTILIYANGNNELAPEMLNSKCSLEKVGSNESISVIMQISLENRKVVEIIRPQECFPHLQHAWTGVRRYYILKNNSILIEDLGKINMASPHVLYNFIKWGIEAYPAKHYMVALCGHGASFIAVMPDLSQEMPYIMTVSDMCNVVTLAIKDTGKNIDLLVLDICYMNLIEIMFELGKDAESHVKNVLTYIRKGPIEGLPYDNLLNIMERNHLLNIKDLIKKIIDENDLNLLHIEINHKKLKQIKRSINDLSYYYLLNKEQINILPEDLIYNSNTGDPYYKLVSEFKNNIEKIIVYHKRVSYTKGDRLNLATFRFFDISKETVNDFMPIYYRLSFAKNNYWSNVISGSTLDISLNDKYAMQVSKLQEFIISPKGLRNLIWAMNASLEEKEIYKIMSQLVSYKKWGFDYIV